MKNKAFWLTFLLFVIAIGGYLTYDYLLNVKSTAQWDFVPATAVAVYEESDCAECVDSVRFSSWIKLFERKLLESVSGDTTFYVAMLKVAKQSQLISMHRTTKNDFDFIFYTHIGAIEEQKIRLEKNTSIKKRQRILDGLIIHELVYTSGTVAWIEKELYAAWSMSPLLIEDVVRAVQEKQEKTFREKLSDVADLPSVKGDGGEILVNLKEFQLLLTGFGEDASAKPSMLGSGSLLDIKRVGNSLVLNGFSSADSADRKSLLSVFEGQTPTPFNFKRFVSNNAQYVINFGFSDTRLLGEKLQQNISDEERSSFLKELSLDKTSIQKLYDGLGQELTVVSLETAGRSVSVLLIDIRGSGEWNEILAEVAEDTSQDTVFVEQFSNYSIHRISSGSITKLLFPFLQTTYDEVYYVQVGNAMMMADDLRGLKVVLEDFDQENTWGKSVEKNRFLESTLLESNISFFVDPKRSKKSISNALHTNWQKFVLKEDALISSLGLSAFQFSYLNKNFYTNIYLTFQSNIKERIPAAESGVIVSLPVGIISKPFVVKNHTDKSHEVLIQDSTYQLYLVSSKGEILWQKKIDGRIRGQVAQVDYFGNGKLQFFICTDKSIHVIDRLGNDVKPFPVSISFSAEHARVIDYDHSKKYRYLLADKQGVMRMTDKNGVLLEGWAGIKTSGELLVPAKHYRVAAKDYMAALNKNGNFTLYSRRAETMNNFPVNLKGRPAGDFYLEVGNKKQQPFFVFIQADGFRVSVDLNGEEVSRETLIKSSLETNFRLVCEENEKSYIIVRQDAKSLTLLSSELKDLVRNEFIGLNKVEVKYYDFGASKIYYVLKDLDQDLVYVYNAEGRLLIEQPVSCDNLSLLVNKEHLWMATTSGQQLRLSILE